MEVNVPIKYAEDVRATFGEKFVRGVVQRLVTLFKDEYPRSLPTEIDMHAFLQLRHMDIALAELADCDGFEQHLAEFHNDVESTYLVTIVAHRLLSRVSELQLEPVIAGTGKRGDIRIVSADGEEVWIECKLPRASFPEHLIEENRVTYEALRESVVRPCDITISSNVALSDESVQEVAAFLKRTLPFVTAEGTLLDVDGIKIDVTAVRSTWQDIGEVEIAMPLENEFTNSRDAITIHKRDGIGMAFCRTGLSKTKSVERQIASSRGQAPDGMPFILAISSAHLLGALQSNLAEISSLFNPGKNTSVNGIALVDWHYSLHEPIVDKYQLVQNPCAKATANSIPALFRV